MSLRPYQVRAVEMLDASLAAGHRRPLLVLATGGGKTRVAAHVIQRQLERGERALFLAPRRELVTQATRALMDAGMVPGVVAAGMDAQGGLYSAVHVASIDTLQAR